MTIDFNISFIKAARSGSFIGKGRLISLGKTIAFTEAELFDDGGDLVARATSQPRLRGDIGRDRSDAKARKPLKAAPSACCASASKCATC